MTFSDEMKQQNSADPLLDVTPAVDRTPLDEEMFRRMIAIERKRTERSMSPFLLILLECVGAQSVKKHKATLDRVTAALNTLRLGSMVPFRFPAPTVHFASIANTDAGRRQSRSSGGYGPVGVIVDPSLERSFKVA